MITGIGWVTVAGMGCGRTDNNFAMIKGRLPNITQKEVSDKLYHRFRRIDKFSRLGLTAIALTLKDAGLDEWTEKRNIGIIASTVYGCLSTDIDYFETVIPQEGLLASPKLFAYTLPNCFIGEASIHFGLTGASFVVNEQHYSGIVCLQIALDSIACGDLHKIVCGVCDLDSPLPSSAPNKWAPGALFFMIEEVPKRDCRPYGRLCLNTRGNTVFNEIEIEDLNKLALECLKVRSGFKRY